MADVKPPRRDGWSERRESARWSDRLRRRRSAGRDRGQLILVTGLAVAVTLVAVVLLLNTVIYTQNLATRGTDVGDGEAVGFRQEAVAGVGGLVDAENRAEYGSRSKLNENVTEAIRRFGDLSSRRYAERGAVADVEVDSLSTTPATLLRQTNASRELRSSDASGAMADWSAASNVERTRNVRLTVSRENLSEDVTTSFAVKLTDDDGGTWKVHLHNESDDVTVTVEEDTGDGPTMTEICSVDAAEATLDLTAGTIDGRACPGLDWASGLDAPYDIEFVNGDQATGTYELTVDTSGAATIPSNFADAGDEASPRAVPAVYAAAFDLHFETERVAFHTRVRVARGEPE